MTESLGSLRLLDEECKQDFNGLHMISEIPRIWMHSDESNPTLMWNCEGYQVASLLRGWSVWANWGVVGCGGVPYITSPLRKASKSCLISASFERMFIEAFHGKLCISMFSSYANMLQFWDSEVLFALRCSPTSTGKVTTRITFEVGSPYFSLYMLAGGASKDIGILDPLKHLQVSHAWSGRTQKQQHCRRRLDSNTNHLKCQILRSKGRLPSTKRTYPTLGKGKSFGRGNVSSLEVKLCELCFMLFSLLPLIVCRLECRCGVPFEALILYDWMISCCGSAFSVIFLLIVRVKTVVCACIYQV